MYPGRWEVRQLKDLPETTKFWFKIIREFTGNNLGYKSSGETKWEGPVQYFDSKPSISENAKVSDSDFTFFLDIIKKNSPILQYQGYVYQRYAVDSDGDCGYTAFGIEREEAYKRVVDNIHNVRDMLKPVVEECLFTQAFIDFLSTREGTENVTKSYHDFKAAQQNKDPQLNQYEENLKRHANDLNLIFMYVDYDIRDKRVDAGWAHPFVLFALAHIQKIHLRLWQLDEQEAMIPHRYYPEYRSGNFDGQTTDLLFVNGNHFDRLEMIVEEKSNLKQEKTFMLNK